ncbi:hypothetical protein SprV_0501861700 [Sparganum proliferum]
MNNHGLLHIDDEAKIVTSGGGGEYVHTPLHVPFKDGVEGAVVGEEKFMDGSCGYTRLEVHPPLIEESAIRPVGDADPGAFVTVPLVSPPDDDIVQQVPMSLPWVHPSGILSHWEAEEGAGQDETVFCAGLIDFYRRFISHCAQLKLPVTGLLENNNRKSYFADTAVENSQRVNEALADAIAHSHPLTDALSSIVASVSNCPIGAALRQQTLTNIQLPTFYSAKLTPQNRHSTFSRELLAIYLAINYFLNYVEGSDLCTYTGNGPLSYAFSTSSDNCSPYEARYLDFISWYTTDIRFRRRLSNQGWEVEGDKVSAISRDEFHSSALREFIYNEFDFQYIYLTSSSHAPVFRWQKSGQDGKRLYSGILKDCFKHAQINPEVCEYLAQDRPAWRRAVKTGAVIHKANRVAAAKVKGAARKSQALPTPTQTPNPFQYVHADNEHSAHGSASSEISAANVTTARQLHLLTPQTLHRHFCTNSHNLHNNNNNNQHRHQESYS